MVYPFELCDRVVRIQWAEDIVALNRLDDISMGIFIWHMVIINIFLYTGIYKSLSDYPLIIVLIVVTVAIAFLSYRNSGKPALKLRNIK